MWLWWYEFNSRYSPFDTVKTKKPGFILNKGAFLSICFYFEEIARFFTISTQEIIKNFAFLVIANFCEMQNQYSSPIKSFRITLITRISGIIFSVYIIFWVKFDYLFWMDLSKHAHNRWSIRVQISLQANITFPLIWLSKSLRKHFHLSTIFHYVVLKICQTVAIVLFFIHTKHL